MHGFFDFSEDIDYPIFFVECNTPATNELFRNTINEYHSYKKFRNSPTRNLRWLIYETSTGNLIGAVGLSSCVLAVACRDNYIGWKLEDRKRNSNHVANNSRFCLIPEATKLKNVASMTLKLLSIIGAKRWKEKYGDDLYLIETYVEACDDDDTYRMGTCYKASNWTYVGNTSGVSIRKSPLKLWKREEGTLRGKLARQNPKACLEKYGKYLGESNNGKFALGKSTPKMVYLKPLTKKWKTMLKG